jgi:hypothetical protein
VRARPLSKRAFRRRGQPPAAARSRAAVRAAPPARPLRALLFYENTGIATSPIFAARTGDANPLDARDVGDAARPAFADLDGDGDFDLLVGNLAGNLEYFENTGDAAVPS